MSLHLTTGYRGTAHVTSADQGAFYAGIVGAGDYVLETGKQFEARIVSNNSIRIFDGDLVMQGRHVTLKNGSYEDVAIANGSQEMNRNDLIVARYKKNITSGVETVSFVVLQGVPSAGTASDPAYTIGDILSGYSVHEMPLYRVKLSGLTVEAVEPLFNTISQVAKILEVIKNIINGETPVEYANYSNKARDGWFDIMLNGEKVASIYGDDTNVTINSHKNSIYLKSNNKVITNTPNGFQVAYNDNGTWVGKPVAASEYNNYSSKIIKENVVDVTEEEALKVLQLTPVNFNYKFDNEKKPNIGLIAEDVIDILPNIVNAPKDYAKSEKEIFEGLSNVLSIDYSKLTPYLVKLCQMQQSKIDDLETRLSVLERK